jgi:hypothetical protein
MFLVFFSLHLKINKMRVRVVVDDFRNILYCFQSSRCNLVLSKIMQLHRCFECFVVRNRVNHQIKTSCEGSRMKNWRLRVLKRLLKTIQSEESRFQVPRSFQAKEWSKTEIKRKKSHLKACLRRSAPGSGQGKHFASAPGALCLAVGQNPLFAVFQAGSVEKKPLFYRLKP